MHARRRALIDRRNKLASELKSLDSELARPDDADERLGNFRPRRNGASPCPYCWMYDRAERPLCLVERDLADAKIDRDLTYFRCSSCGNTFTESGENDTSQAHHADVGHADPSSAAVARPQAWPAGFETVLSQPR